MKSERFAFCLTIVIVIGTFMFFADSGDKGKLYSDSHPAQVEVFSPTNNKQLVFDDEFSGSTIDSRKWSTCYDWKLPNETGCTNAGNFEQQWYSDSQLSVNSGNLTITAIRKPTQVAVKGQVKTFDYQSGMINTGSGDTTSKGHWIGSYGYYEAKILIPKGQAIWPAFWLLPADRNWPPEIDAMEFVGSKPNQILQTVHWSGADGRAEDMSVILKNVDYSQSWHTYGIDWQPGQIDWYIDGVKTKTFKGSNVPSKPMEIILNLAVGGNLPGAADATTPPTATMKVDYVRVYQSKDQIRPVSN